MEIFNYTITILSLIGASLAWIAKLKWSKEFKEAKNAEIKAKIAQKEQGILQKIKNKYGIFFKVPIIISNKLPNRNFGMAVYDPSSKKIAIYLIYP